MPDADAVASNLCKQAGVTRPENLPPYAGPRFLPIGVPKHAKAQRRGQQISQRFQDYPKSQMSSWHSRLSIKNQLCPFTSPRPDVHYIAADLLIPGGESLQRRGGRAGGLCSGHSGRLHFEGAASSGHLVGEQCKDDQRLVGLVFFFGPNTWDDDTYWLLCCTS